MDRVSLIAVRNLTGNVEAIKYARFTFPTCKMLRRGSKAGDQNLGILRKKSGWVRLPDLKKKKS